MMKVSSNLTKSEEELMELFWKTKEPLTSVEVLNTAIDRSWNGSYLHIMLTSLLKKGMLKVCGMVQYGTQYARQFVPSMTKEEYMAKLVASKGMGKNAIAKVAMALVKEVGDQDEKDLIEQLEEIIKDLKEEETKEK